ncbi:unnamed protein product [Rhizoctonia solani]|uniref:Uncharacterized protein n=1 Tax=Rhizoctonia solani TaxID=456999 RepID=A0A8H3BT84_9AGAM|nr:unnamed protein product [Rhizoctonia solani]
MLSKNELRLNRIALLIYRIPDVTANHDVPPGANFHPASYPNHNPILIFEFPELHPSWEITRQQFMLGSEPLPNDVVSGEAQVVSVVDFNAPVIRRHAYTSATTSRAKRPSADKGQKFAVLHGKGMTIGRLFQPNRTSNKLPLLTTGQALNQEVATETIESDMKTIIRNGFKEPVESCLPYRVVTKMQQMPLHGHWRIHGEYLVGVPMRDFSGEQNRPFSLYKLELASQD